MSAIQFFNNDLLLEVGRIAALRGSLRLSLLSAGDALLSTRLGDQGIIRLAMHGREITEICRTLQMLGQVRGAAATAIQTLVEVAREYGPDFELAAAVANGSWTYLGGDELRHYGLFLGEAEQNGDLLPQWREMTVTDLRELAERLNQAHEALRPLSWAMRAASGGQAKPPPN
jgi:hypothetical protein